MFLLESPYRGDSNEYTQYTIFNKKKRKSPKNYPKSASTGFFEGTQERVRNSHGKRALSFRATECGYIVSFLQYKVFLLMCILIEESPCPLFRSLVSMIFQEWRDTWTFSYIHVTVTEGRATNTSLSTQR